MFRLIGFFGVDDVSVRVTLGRDRREALYECEEVYILAFRSVGTQEMASCQDYVSWYWDQSVYHMYSCVVLCKVSVI